MNKHPKKIDRLIKKEDISILFKKGEVFYNFPFRLIWTKRSENDLTRVLISVPKKSFKKAVDRNLIKRQVKEIFYNKIINKYLKGEHFNLVITYIGDQKINFKELENTLIITFRKFITKQ